MIAKLKKAEKIEQEMIKKKLAGLSVLATEFLEKSFCYESLVRDRKEMEKIKTILLDNLWRGNINPDDPNWCPETDSEFAMMILHFHRLLTEGFWNSFKKELKLAKDLEAPIMAPPGYEGLENENLVNIDGFIKIWIPQDQMTVRLIRNSEKVEFMRDSVDAIPALLDLLQGLPMENLRFCANAECKKFIVKTTGKNRIFCDGKCQSQQYQRELREKNPDQFKQYHREYYRMVKERKNRKKKIGKGENTRL
ncbi:MAG TPA: hypothetical protein PLQ69_07850 [Paludibacter sp.]|jgi:hypothetical protein|nr:hypothetical protein [Paludibacter sp.]